MKYITKKHLGMYAIAFAFVFSLSAVSSTDYLMNPGAPQSVEIQKSSMEETISSLNMDVKIPTYLPDNMLFETSEVARDGKSANIVFSNESMKIEYYLQETSFNAIKSLDTPTENIVVTVHQDGEFVSSTEYPQTGKELKRLVINGVDGVFVEGDENSSATTSWYANGVFYNISGDLSEEQLIRISNSIQ